jgi:uncharacterized protein (DUF1015 family)
MAEIQPLRAWRYNDALSKNIGAFICPPFDVVSEEQKQSLYHEPLNSIHISVPQGEDPVANAATLLEKWKREGIIQQEAKPSLYVYYQHFSFPGESKKYIRKGFICNIRAYFWDEKVVLRHENTLPYSVNDRLELLAATQLNASPTHGLYTDEKFILEALMDDSMQQPIYDIEDYQGTRDVISIIDDPDIIRTFMATLAEKQIILADGHHRYESSLRYRKQQMQNNLNHAGDELYNYHLMYLTNTEGDDLRILPTHRLIHLSAPLDTSEILTKALLYFNIQTVDIPEDIPALIEGKHWTFGLLLSNTAQILTLKPEVHHSLHWDMPGMDMSEMVKNTDLVVLHYFFIEKVLGIIGEAQRHDKGILYERSFEICLQDVQNREANLALIVNGVSIEQVKNICYNGYLMPQKSTFFFPKAICGFVFGSIKETEK